MKRNFAKSNLIHSDLNRFLRGGSALPIMLLGLALLSAAGVTFYYLASGTTESFGVQPIMTTVERGQFVSQVLDQGEVQSSENVEIRCEVRARNGALSVIEVVPEGSRVNGGDFLVRLDSTSFEKELETQKISVANSQTSVIQADAELKTATETLKEYEQGIFVEKKKEIENAIYTAKSEIETAKQQLTQAKAVLEHSKKLQGKGFITSQQLEADGFEVTRSEFALKTAENQLELAEKQEEVLVTITQVKETVKLRSDIEAAKVKLSNQRESLVVEKSKLDEIKQQISKCEIRVPEGVSGQVVYAKESVRGGNDWVMEEGTSVRERQVLIRLPNPDKMEVKALINEQSITQIRVGMPASIQVDALTNQALKGIVTKVNQYAESSGWMSSSVRKYAVLVEIDDPPPALKPGMNSAVNIQVRYEQDAIKTPIQTVYAVGDRYFCLINTGDEENDEWSTREIEIDGDNSKFVLVKSGLEKGDRVVMNPGSFKEHMELPELDGDTSIEVTDSMKEKMAEYEKDATAKIGQVSAAGKPAEAGGDAPQRAGRRGPGGGGSGRPGGGRGGRPGGGGGGFDMPANGKALIKDKDRDSDGKLTKDEAGSPYSFFFDRVDTNSDGFLDEAELDVSITQMKQRMQSGGFGGGGRPGGGGGPR